MTISLKIIGIVLLISGLLLAFKPTIISKTPLPNNSYQIIKMRVVWGFPIGVGMLFIFHNQWGDLKLTLCALLIFLTLGIIFARLLGMVLDGFLKKQLLWLTMEIVAFIFFVVLYRYADN